MCLQESFKYGASEEVRVQVIVGYHLHPISLTFLQQCACRRQRCETKCQKESVVRLRHFAWYRLLKFDSQNEKLSVNERSVLKLLLTVNAARSSFDSPLLPALTHRSTADVGF